MTLNLRDKFDEILFKACEWVKYQESIILEKGVPLLSKQITYAEKIRVAYPDRIKILLVSKIPLPEEPILYEACTQLKFITPKTIGLTLQYGIFVRSDCAKDSKILCHELAHVAQYEKFGGIRPFLEQYFYELMTIGYNDMPMELQARKAEAFISF